MEVGKTNAGWWGLPTPLKNDGVSSSVGGIFPNIWKNQKCSKPPNSMYIYLYIYICLSVCLSVRPSVGMYVCMYVCTLN